MTNLRSSSGIIIYSLCFGFLLLSLSLNAQPETDRILFSRIPENYLDHPELGMVFPKGITNDVDYELIHLRDEYSRTFLNKSGSLTTVHSSVPLHFKDESGRFLTLDYRLTNSEGKTYHIPSHNPEHHFDNETHEIHFYRHGTVNMVTGQNRKIHLYDNNNEQIITYLPNLNSEKTIILDREIIIENLFNGTDVHHFFSHNFLKTNYILRNADFILPSTAKLVLEEEVRVPVGWNFVYEYENNTLTGRLLLTDDSSQEVFIIQHPVVSDSKEVDLRIRNDLTQYYGEYSFNKINDTTYIIKLTVDASWLKHPDRVYPVIIDPTVVLNSTALMNSCFYPNYQQGALNLNVPVGHTIYNTYLEWEFTATSGSGAWKSDQRSYVTGPNNQTFVFNGIGDESGTQIYTLDNSFIANGTSTGNVTITFYAGRTWGGSGCDATFNFINRRYVEITHDMIVFGPGQIIINEYSASNTALYDGFGRSEDWVELMNTSSNYVDMSGYYLSDNPGNHFKWQISSGFIPLSILFHN